MTYYYITVLIFSILIVHARVEGRSLPGSRLWSSSWKETKNSKEYLWLNGGVGYGEQQGQGRGLLSDLWSFDIEKKSWNYKKSYSGINQEPSYKAPFTPGSSFATSIWQIEGKLYNYNTNLVSLKSSMWKYVDDEWQLIHGPHKNTEYGEKGKPNMSNTPGNRFLSAHWKDNNNNLYLFGGIKGEDSIFLFDYNYTFNDLWVYNESIGWTWIHGDKEPNSKGIYGYKGLPTKNTVPPARYECSFASNSTHAIIFGGLTSYKDGTLCLNDMWLYDIEKNEWTWIAGDQLGTLNNDDNSPIPRTGTMLWWDNNDDSVYIYGGITYIDSIPFQKGDMWKFDMNTYVWTKIFDDPDISVSKSFNESYPGYLSRASTWTDEEGNLWLFGGNIEVNLSGDLWQFDTEELKWSFVAGFKEHDKNSIIRKLPGNPIIITLTLCLILVVLVLVISLIITCRSRKKSPNTEENEKLLIQRIRDEEDFDPYASHASLTPVSSINSSSINIKDLNKQDKIKRGKSGPIWFGTYRQSAVAIHEIQDVTQQEYDKIKKYVSTLSNMSFTCENVVKVYGSLLKDETSYIIEEWAGEALSNCYVGKTYDELFSILKGIAFGMSYLHTEKMNRRVLSPHNIFISPDNIPKIRYFSYFDILLNDKKDSDFLISETVRYMSPESILDQEFSEPSDVWSFGILVYELFSGKIPFEEVKNPIVLSIKISNEYLTPKLPKDIPEWLSEIVLQCWDPNPSYRPSFAQLYNVIEMNTNK